MNIDYPYLPEGRTFKYVPHDNIFMLEAKKARENLSGDPVYPVGGVLVKDGKVVVSAGNGYNLGSFNVHICPRIVHECPSGQGYDLCTLHDDPGHSEQMTVKVAQEKGIDTNGADFYMYGHWWACEPCWKSLIDAGVRDVYIVDDAHERFHRDIIHKQVCTPTIKSVYIAGSISSLPKSEFDQYLRLYERMAEKALELDIEPFVPHLHSEIEKDRDRDVKEVFDMGEQEIAKRDAFVADVTYPSHGVGMEIMNAYKLGKPIVLFSKKGTQVSRYVKQNPAVVYHAEYEDFDQACKFFKNILMQM